MIAMLRAMFGDLGPVVGGADGTLTLLTRRPESFLPDLLAPGQPGLGFMLPSSPLHQLLLDDVGGPVVATSGNRSEEPVCTENEQAFDVSYAYRTNNTRESMTLPSGQVGRGLLV